MTIKQKIEAELDKIDDSGLAELYRVVQDFVAAHAQPKAGIMTKLQNVVIDAPADFAAQFDRYASGEKRVAEDLH